MAFGRLSKSRGGAPRGERASEADCLRRLRRLVCDACAPRPRTSRWQHSYCVARTWLVRLSALRLPSLLRGGIEQSSDAMTLRARCSIASLRAKAKRSGSLAAGRQLGEQVARCRHSARRLSLLRQRGAKADARQCQVIETDSGENGKWPRSTGRTNGTLRFLRH